MEILLHFQMVLNFQVQVIHLSLPSYWNPMHVPLCPSNFQVVNIFKEHEKYHRKRDAESVTFTLLSALGEDIYHWICGFYLAWKE